MAKIVWESEEESWCSDCGELGVTQCSCEECELCSEYSESIEFRDDVKDADYVCFDCYTEIEAEQDQCECCDLYDETVQYYDTDGYDYLCEECFKDEIVVEATDSVLNLFKKVQV